MRRVNSEVRMLIARRPIFKSRKPTSRPHHEIVTCHIRWVKLFQGAYTWLTDHAYTNAMLDWEMCNQLMYDSVNHERVNVIVQSRACCYELVSCHTVRQHTTGRCIFSRTHSSPSKLPRKINLETHGTLSNRHWIFIHFVVALAHELVQLTTW